MLVRWRAEHAPKVESNNANGTHGDTASTADGIYHRFESGPDFRSSFLKLAQVSPIVETLK
jgi:hypothetical protein